MFYAHLTLGLFFFFPLKLWLNSQTTISINFVILLFESFYFIVNNMGNGFPSFDFCRVKSYAYVQRWLIKSDSHAKFIKIWFTHWFILIYIFFSHLFSSAVLGFVQPLAINYGFSRVFLFILFIFFHPLSMIERKQQFWLFGCYRILLCTIVLMLFYHHNYRTKETIYYVHQRNCNNVKKISFCFCVIILMKLHYLR